MDKNQLKRLAGLPVVLEKFQPKQETKKVAPAGLFLEGTKVEISAWLHENHSNFAGAVATLNSYINEAGRTIDIARRATLEACKDELRKAYGVKEALEPFDLQLLRKMAGLSAAPVVEKEEAEVDDAKAAGAAPEGEASEEGEDEMPVIIAKIAAKVEGKTGDELIELIQKVYDAGFKDGEEAHEAEGEEEVKESTIAEGNTIVTNFEGFKNDLMKKLASGNYVTVHVKSNRPGVFAYSFQDATTESIDEGIFGKKKQDQGNDFVSDSAYNAIKQIVKQKYPGFEVHGLGQGKNGAVNVQVANLKSNESKDIVISADELKNAGVTEAARKPKAAEPEPSGNLTASVGVDKEDDAGWMAVELAKAGMAVDMEEAMGVFYFNFKNKSDEAKARKLAEKLQIALV